MESFESNYADFESNYADFERKDVDYDKESLHAEIYLFSVLSFLVVGNGYLIFQFFRKSSIKNYFSLVITCVAFSDLICTFACADVQQRMELWDV